MKLIFSYPDGLRFSHDVQPYDFHVYKCVTEFADKAEADAFALSFIRELFNIQIAYED